MCFLILALASGLQLYDFLRIIYYVSRSMKVSEIKDNFRHMFTIGAYIIGLTLSPFSLWIIDPITYYYGVSFWICIGTVCLFVAVVVCEKIEVRNVEKEKLIEDLLKEERKIREH